MYCGYACSLVAVDVEATTRAFAQLFADPALRRRMGEAGRQRIASQFSTARMAAAVAALYARLTARPGEARHVA